MYERKYGWSNNCIETLFSWHYNNQNAFVESLKLQSYLRIFFDEILYDKFDFSDNSR